MTDEQWVWLFANQNLDADERFENMCSDCQREVTQERHCVRCGKRIDGIDGNDDSDGEETVVNSSFDMEKYEAMKNGTYQTSSEENEEKVNFDMELLRQLVDDNMNKEVGD